MSVLQAFKAVSVSISYICFNVVTGQCYYLFIASMVWLGHSLTCLNITSIKDVVWDIFVFALGNTPGFHLIRAKVCSVFKLKFALNIPYYVYLFLET